MAETVARQVAELQADVLIMGTEHLVPSGGTSRLQGGQSAKMSMQVCVSVCVRARV